jgi:hypothetical protein
MTVWGNHRTIVLGDADFNDTVAIRDWIESLEPGTYLMPLMQHKALVRHLRRMTRSTEVSVMTQMDAVDKWKYADAVVVFGVYEMGAKHRAEESGLPWTTVEETPPEITRHEDETLF